MRLLTAVLCTALFATPAAADAGPVVTHGTLDDATAAYAGCVHVESDPASYCLIAVRDAGATTVTSVVRPPSGPATVRRVTLDASALRTGAAGIRATVRLVATLPGVGDVDLTSYSGPALSRFVVNDTCTEAPVQFELTSAAPALSFVAWTEGTIARAAASNAGACSSALAAGPATGAWRTASGL